MCARNMFEGVRNRVTLDTCLHGDGFDNQSPSTTYAFVFARVAIAPHIPMPFTGHLLRMSIRLRLGILRTPICPIEVPL